MKIVANEKNARVIDEINRILKTTTLYKLQEKRNGSLRFVVYQNKKNAETDISELELSVRSYNALKRAGFHTVGDVVDHINGQEDLMKFRNLGKNSAQEIMFQLFLYQFQVLDGEKQVRYIQKFRELNE